MLAEVLTWLSTPASRDARRTGHLTAAVSLWSRAFRCRGAWAAHEAACHGVVEQAIEGLKQTRTCLVLGSGLLRDVPFERLAATFERVILVDVVHLWPARLKVRGRANVTLVEMDVTGTTDLLLGRATGIADPLARFRGDATIDLVISANCLSQIALLPTERTARRGGLARSRFPDLGRRIVAGHVEALMRFSGRVCLLSDSVSIEFDGSGAEIERHDLLEGVVLPPADADWDWELAPLGEAGRDRRIVHRAHGWVDLHRSAAQRRGVART